MKYSLIHFFVKAAAELTCLNPYSNGILSDWTLK